MPKVDGLQVPREMKSDPRLKAIPIVILTSSREANGLEECYKHGVNAYVVKPVKFNEFVDAVKEIGMFWAPYKRAPAGQPEERDIGAILTGELEKDMKHSLRVLHLEDNKHDAELIRARLQQAGFDCEITHTQTEKEFVAALGGTEFDVIISDFSLPSFDGMKALALAQEKIPHVPFIFVSGTIGEDAAIESLLNGATDYVLKTGEMKRLIPALQRALKESEAREEHKRLEAQYRQAQKMEAVGRLAGGVAHDFNNLLTAILGLSELSIQELPPGNAMRKDLEEIKATALRAAQLTKQLLAFSRRQMVEPKILKLNDLLENLQKMLQRIIGEDIEFVFRPERNLGLIHADPGQMEQLIVNLAVNARDAMPHGGTLTIQTAEAVLDEAFVRGHPGASRGRFVLLSIRDTGVGMSEEVKTHLFEPFFTTKEQGKGTGLGLATCYGIVKQNGGYIDVDSVLYRGTTFTVYLPQASGEPAPQENDKPSSSSPGGTETILLIEDEALVRNLAARVLKNLGYKVIVATDDSETLQAINNDRDREIRALITDVVMPGAGGKKLAEMIAELRPDIKAIFTSGYNEAISRQGVLNPGVHFISKPFTAEALARKLRDALDG